MFQAQPASPITLQQPNFAVENAVPGATWSSPVGLAFLPDGRYLVAEKRGRVYLVANGAKASTPVWSQESKVLNNGDRGLLGITVDPDYANNRYVYLMYTVDPDSNGTDDNDDAYGRLVRYTMNAATTSLDEASRIVLFGRNWREGATSGSTSHTIGSLRFGRDGSLLVTVGDGGQFNNMDPGGLDPNMFGANFADPNEDIGAFRAQYLDCLPGKLLRINPLNGEGYPSNPYYDGDPRHHRSKVWAYGLRNPFRFNVRPGTGNPDPAAGSPGVVMIGDVGWTAWEDLNVCTAPGQNFGWPCYEGLNPNSSYQGAAPSHHGCGTLGTAANPATNRSPASTWPHGSGTSVPAGIQGNSSIGGVFYSSTVYPASLQGAFFYGDFGFDWIRIATFNASHQLQTVSSFATAAAGPCDFAVDPITGDVHYIALDSNEIRRIRYTGSSGGNNPPTAAAAANPTSGTAPLTVNFSSAGSSDPNGDPLTYQWSFGDGNSSSSANPTNVYTSNGSYTAILTVSDGRGGQATASASVLVGAPTGFPATGILDNFDRANGAIGSAWSGNTAGFAISSNRLIATGYDPWGVYNGATFGPDQEAYIRFNAITATAPEHNLMLKVQGLAWNLGHIEVRYDARLAVVYVNTYTPGSGWAGRGTIPASFAAGDRFGARALANGTVNVYKNGVQIGAASVAGWPYAASGGRLGFIMVSAAASQLDDFGGGNVVSGPPANVTPSATITSPADGSFFYAGQVVQLNGTATDDSPLDSLEFTWSADLYHNNHIHPEYVIRSGRQASFVGEEHDDGTGVWMKMKLIVTDRAGAADTEAVNLYPEVDLVASPVTVTPATINPGDPVQYRFAIRNSGRMLAPISRWRLRAGNLLLAEGDTIVDHLDSVVVVRTLPAPASGTYALRLVVDTLRTVTETNESNNATTRSLVVTGPVAGFPVAPVLDDFNRANGAIGSSWSGNTAGFAIASNRLTATGYDPWGIYNLASFGPDQEAYITFNAVTATAPEHNLMLKVQGLSWNLGHIEVRYDAKRSLVLLATYAPGVGWQGRGSFAATFAAGDRFGARALSNGTVTVYKNATVIGTASVAGWPFAATGGRLGFIMVSATASQLDDFGGGNAPASAVAAPLLASRALVESSDRTAVVRWETAAETRGVVRFGPSIPLEEVMETPVGTRHEAVFGHLEPGRRYYYQLTVYDADGNLVEAALDSLETAPSRVVVTPQTLFLSNAFPNPAHGSVQMMLELPAHARVGFSVFDVGGRRVFAREDRESEAGRWALGWPGTSSSGNRVQPGLYFIRVTVNGAPHVRRVAMLQ